MTENKSKSSWTVMEGLKASGLIIALISALEVGYKVYYDVQQLKDQAGNQQADIYQLERKIKEIYIFNDTMINKLNLPSKETQNLIDQLHNMQTDWYRHTDAGKNKIKSMFANPPKRM